MAILNNLMTTYSQLQSDIASWLDRDDLSNKITTFIKIGEQEINRKLRVLEMEELAQTPLSTTSQYYDLPPRFIKVRNVYTDIAANNKLGYVTPGQMTLSVADSGTTPKQYTIVDGKIKLDRTFETSSNNLFIAYYQKFEELSSTNTTNWLTENAYALLLYAGILAAEIYLYNDERIPLIRVEFDRIITELNEEAEEGRYGGDMLGIRAV